MTASLAGCGSSKDGSGKSVKLDPDHPVSLTIWHYYNGAQQAMFDTLVKEFNASVGKEEGVYVESYSQIYRFRPCCFHSQLKMQSLLRLTSLTHIFSSYFFTPSWNLMPQLNSIYTSVCNTVQRPAAMADQSVFEIPNLQNKKPLQQVKCIADFYGIQYPFRRFYMSHG